MRLIPEPLLISEEDGYDKGVIDRTEFGNFLTNLVRGTKEPLVVAIDGRWGEGKSTFVKIWRNQLECRGPWKHNQEKLKTPTLYIDAFKMEATDDIFISLVAEIDAFVSERCGNKERLDSLRDAAIKLGSKLLPIAAKVAIRAASMNTLTYADIKDFAIDPDSISKSISEQAEKLLADRLQSLVGQKKVIDEFQRKLSELPETIVDNPSKQLVLIIDELDRCSPKYAVEFLEKIKHFFSSENIKFVLVINKYQLESSVRSIYGNGVDASEYLQKFIDIECVMPRNNNNFEATDAKTFCYHLADHYQFEDAKCADRFAEIVSKFAEYGDLSLRQVEKVFSTFAILDTISNGKIAKSVSFRLDVSIFACVAKVLDRGFCIKAMQNKIAESDFSNLIEKIIHRNFNDNDFAHYINCVRHFCLTKPEFQSLNSPLAKSILVYCGESDDVRRNLLPDIVSMLYGISK